MIILKFLLCLSLAVNLAFAAGNPPGASSSIGNGLNILNRYNHSPHPPRAYSTPDQKPMTVTDEPPMSEAVVAAEIEGQAKRRSNELKRSNKELEAFCSKDPFDSEDPHNNRVTNNFRNNNDLMSKFRQCYPFPSDGHALENLFPLLSTSTFKCLAVGSFQTNQRISSFTCGCSTPTNKTQSVKAQLASQFDSKKIKTNAVKDELKELNRLNDHIKYVTSTLTSQGFDPSKIDTIRPNTCNTAEIISIVNNSASQFNASSNSNKICDGQECSQVGQFVTSALQEMFQLPNGSQAQLTAEFDSMGPVSCFEDPKQEFVANLIPINGIGKSILLGKIGLIKVQLAANLSAMGSCEGSSKQNAFNRLSTMNDLLNRPWRAGIDQESFSAWRELSRYNPAINYLVEHVVHEGAGSFSTQDCLKVKEGIQKSQEFFTALSRGLSIPNSVEALKHVTQAHVAYLEGTKLNNYQDEVFKEIKEDFQKKCSSFANKVRAIACANDSQISSSLNLYARYLDQSSSEQKCSNTNSAACLERNKALCAMRANSDGGVSSLDAATYRYSQSERPASEAGSIARNELSQYCPNFEGFVKSQGICVNEDFNSCYRSFQFGSQDDRARLRTVLGAYKASLSGDIRAVHENIVDISATHTAQVDAVDRQIRSAQGASTIAAMRSQGLSSSKDELSEIASIFGGLGGGGGASNLSSDVSGSFFNQAIVQGFGAQARVSPATSAAVMNRFISNVPPMQNMPQSDQRQQVEQALERSVNQTVSELETKASGATSASERQKYLDEIAELRRLMADQTARNDLISQQMAAMNQASQEEVTASSGKRKRAPASVANAAPEVSSEGASSGFQSGGGRSSSQASSGSTGGGQDLSGVQGFGGSAAAARSVSSVSEARDAAPNDNSLRLIVGGTGGQVIPAAQVITITVSGGDEKALKEAILGQREKLNIGEDGFAIVEVIDPNSGRATLVRVKIENENVIVQNFTAEQLRQTKIVSDADPKPRQIRYSLQAMTNLLNQASGGSN